MRYPDLFRNALMSSHQVITRGEFWYGSQLLTSFDVITGSISADRAGSVRRTAQVAIDPNLDHLPVLNDKIRPYGTHIKLFRGIRHLNGIREEYQCFYGRIDSVERSLAQISIRASDKAADIVDARFETETWAGSYGTIGNATTGTCSYIAKALILEVLPSATVTVEGITADMLVTADTSWTRERSDAMDSLCSQIGAEWFADMFGAFHIRKLPAVAAPGATPVWVIDSGDNGVLVNRTSVDDRQGVYNKVVVISEPFNGRDPARGVAIDDDAGSDTIYGGAFGKVTGFYEGQQVDSNANAALLAEQFLQQGLASVDSVSVECVPNPKLQLADLIRVFDVRNNIDGMYFIQSFDLPLDPETSMKLTLYSARQLLATGRFGKLKRSIPEGAIWEPTR